MTETGDLIRFVRQSCGLSQKQLGELMGIRQCNVSQYETGVYEPKYARLVEILDVCGYELIVRKKRGNS